LIGGMVLGIAQAVGSALSLTGDPCRAPRLLILIFA
jgi:hypothetical protein